MHVDFALDPRMANGTGRSESPAGVGSRAPRLREAGMRASFQAFGGAGGRGGAWGGVTFGVGGGVAGLLAM